MAAMNKILDRLYLGNIKAASDIKMLKAAVSVPLSSCWFTDLVFAIYRRA